MRHARQPWRWLCLALAFMAWPAAGANGMMQAAAIVAGKVVILSMPVPEPQAGEVRVRIVAAAVNPVDWRVALGRPVVPGVGAGSTGPEGAAAVAPRAVIGYDGAGVVDAVGPGVSAWKVGDEVIVWTPRHGTYAQYAIVNLRDEGIARKPPNVPFAAAAAFGHAALAAWSGLVDVAKVQNGQRVLILGGSGGVGSAAIQIARNRGAHVIATASTRNQSFMRELGAHETIDYTQVKFQEQLKNVDVVLNAVDPDNASEAVSVVRPGGFLVSLIGLPPAERCRAAQITCTLRLPTAAPGATPVSDVLRQFADWAAAGKLNIPVDRTYPLSKVADAWAYSQGGRTRGKVIIQVGQ